MAIQNRPYVGTWRLGQQKVVQHTPDTLIYLNGDLALPGCAKCNSRINIQEFVTEVSVDAGTDPGASSASFTLSVPVHHYESFARDAQFILRPGLEVHIYQRGYFPVDGLYSAQIQGARLPAYPYYHVFHGVTTQVGSSYSAGVQTFSVQCGSMLHFWQFQQVSTNASIFGPRAKNSQLQSSLIGHNYTGKHPYEIMWHIHNDFISAAAGVGFVTQNQTNQTAMYGQQSLYSLQAKYWEERFRTSSIRLRMHGATGQMFNAAQAAFLGRASSAELMKLTRNRFNTRPVGAKHGGDIFSSSAIRGAWTPEVAQSLLFLNKSGSSRKNVEMNIVEMKAFVSDIGQWGQANLFESTYESKLDIANKVCEVTGFEFYQDVDGDFVFKPPFYNLDTSSSRVYRIEDIDIINISSDEKEPEATYITAKGAAFKNLNGTGAENEWGVQGQYLDYRLIAQYGWRPADFETAYFNDASSMFFAAVNRLDILNSVTKSASVTIPHRPEMRAGYPVYIPSLDCYYYCPSLSHSYVVGGQCTTTLQLTAKRAKFFAPGDPNLNGIEAIHLDNPSYPARPLQVEDNMQRPALKGFPNVVMALDPNRIDPKMLLLGSDVYDVSNPTILAGIIKVALDKKIITYPPGTNGGNIFEMQESSGTVTQFYFGGDLSSLVPGTMIQQAGNSNLPDLTAGANKYSALSNSISENRAALKKAIQKNLVPLTKADHAYRNAPMDNSAKAKQKRAAAKAQRDAAEKKVRKLQAEYNAYDGAVSREMDKLDPNDPTKILFRLIDQLLDSTLGGRPDLQNTSFLLELLSDKKAVFTNGSLPGYYRYYSASHPNPADQGMPSLTIDGTDVKTHTTTVEVLAGGEIDGEGFLPEISVSEQAHGVDASYGSIKVKRGIRVFDGDPGNKKGVVLPTSEIKELMFSPTTFNALSVKTTVKATTNLGSMSSVCLDNIQESALIRSGSGEKGTTLSALFDPWVTQLSQNIQTAMTNAAPDIAPEGISPLNQLNLYGTQMLASDTAASFALSDSVTSGGKQFYGSDRMDTREFWTAVARVYMKTLRPSIVTAFNKWQKKVLSTSSGSESEKKTIVSTAYSDLAGQYGGQAPATSKRTQSKVAKQIVSNSPVFPVSDSRGYEVVGSYRYGRDVDIDENGVFANLVNASALQRLDIKSVDLFINGLMKAGQTITGQQAQELARNLSKAYPEDSKITDLLSKSPDNNPNTSLLTEGLRGWYMNQLNDGVAKAKVQLVNAAYTLADLKPSFLQTCTCKAAEANVVLDMASGLEFVPITEGFLENDNNPLTNTLIQDVEYASSDWKVHQDALRGEILDRFGGDTVKFISSLDETLQAAKNRSNPNGENNS